MPPWMIGCWMPNSSVIAVFTTISCASGQWTILIPRRCAFQGRYNVQMNGQTMVILNANGAGGLLLADETAGNRPTRAAILLGPERCARERLVQDAVARQHLLFSGL